MTMQERPLGFPAVPVGSGGTPIDLVVFIYRGGAKLRIDKALVSIRDGLLGSACPERRAVVESLHEEIQSKVALGKSAATINSTYFALVNFFKWLDEDGRQLNYESLTRAFIDWTEHLIHRYSVVGDLKQKSAYQTAVNLASCISPVIGLQAARSSGRRDRSPASSLMRITRLRGPRSGKGLNNGKDDKQDLSITIRFCQFLSDICNGLSADNLRAPLPISVRLSDGREILLNCGLKRAGVLTGDLSASARRSSIVRRARAAVAEDVSLAELGSRSAVINIRIHAELLVLIAQTGMNLQQAAFLERNTFRWRTEGDQAIAFLVHKGRRGGGAIFRAFKQYRDHLERYLKWLDAVGLSAIDNRLFPFLPGRGGRVRASGDPGSYEPIRGLCRTVGVPFIGAQGLRKTRVNWLLRNGVDVVDAAILSAHAPETMLAVYEEPHHQVTIDQVTRFHRGQEAALAAASAGVCVSNRRTPDLVEGAPHGAPKPDCINPAGCLFCKHHRDVASEDYVRRLVSERTLRVNELALWTSSKKFDTHPANALVERITEKLAEFSAKGSPFNHWVNQATDDARAGVHHPHWVAQIELSSILL